MGASKTHTNRYQTLYSYKCVVKLTIDNDNENTYNFSDNLLKLMHILKSSLSLNFDVIMFVQQFFEGGVH